MWKYVCVCGSCMCNIYVCECLYIPVNQGIMQRSTSEKGGNLPPEVGGDPHKRRFAKGPVSQLEKGLKQSSWKGPINQKTWRSELATTQIYKDGQREQGQKGWVGGEPEIDKHVERLRSFFLVKGFCCKGSHFSPKTFIQPFVFSPCFFLCGIILYTHFNSICRESQPNKIVRRSCCGKCMSQAYIFPQV